MKFNLDTNDYENIKLTFSENECEQDVFELIEEFCYATASFFTVFSLKQKCNTEQAQKLKKAFSKCTERYIDVILEQGVLDVEQSENEDVDDSIEELKAELKNAGFSEVVINNVIQLLNKPEGAEEAIAYLQQISNDIKIDKSGNEKAGVFSSKRDEKNILELLQSISEQIKKIDIRTANMDEKIDIIDNKLDALEEWLKAVCDIVEKGKVSTELAQAKTEREFEEIRTKFINATAREIANIACSDTASVDYEESQLKGLFGDCWYMLDGYTRRSLVSAKVFASNCRKTSYQVLDHSGTIVLVTSALENELKLRFFVGYQDYLLKTFGEPSEDKWPASILFTTKKGQVVRNNEFTLGSLPYIFDCSEKDKATLERYLKTIVGDRYVDNAIASLYLKFGKDHFVARCENVRVKYRNKAAHTESVSMELAEKCCSDVIGLQAANEHIGQVQGLLFDLVRITKNFTTV